jgi:hypothetical protein
MKQHLAEMEGASVQIVDEDSRAQQQNQLAATEPSLDFSVVGMCFYFVSVCGGFCFIVRFYCSFLLNFGLLLCIFRY